MTRLTQGSIALALLIGAVAIACGGGGDDKVRAETPEEYARAVCEAMAKHSGEFEEIGEQLATFDEDLSPDNLSPLGDLLALMGPTLRGLAKDLGDIEPPSDAKEQHDNIVSTFDEAGQAFEDAEDLLEKPFAEAMEGFAEFGERFDSLGEGFDAFEAAGPEYEEALQNEPACQALEDVFTQF